MLLECLEYLRGLWKLCSKNYDTLEPMAGMEDTWAEYRVKCGMMQDLIHALDSESVRHAVAHWQMDVMEHGPGPLKLDGNEKTAFTAGGKMIDEENEGPINGPLGLDPDMRI